ncbi:4a-hydroxytetrahydrobiopterin dehydratase [Flexivirga alba]|uniref:Putative pterin-4-alpha-carbinolamine dehydratase n=1 Tax=Flexivirga alba TaxID=702742 RepID=A0ABW2AKY2_9MICO
MPEEVSSEEFHASDGVGDWRITGDGARARFRTGSFTTGVKLVAEIGRLADAANHHPDVDLRYGHVGVRTWTHELPGISERDVALAGRSQQQRASWESRRIRLRCEVCSSPSTPFRVRRSCGSGRWCWGMTSSATKI